MVRRTRHGRANPPLPKAGEGDHPKGGGGGCRRLDLRRSWSRLNETERGGGSPLHRLRRSPSPVSRGRMRAAGVISVLLALAGCATIDNQGIVPVPPIEAPAAPKVITESTSSAEHKRMVALVRWRVQGRPPPSAISTASLRNSSTTGRAGGQDVQGDDPQFADRQRLRAAVGRPVRHARAAGARQRRLRGRRPSWRMRSPTSPRKHAFRRGPSRKSAPRSSARSPTSSRTSSAARSSRLRPSSRSPASRVCRSWRPTRIGITTIAKAGYDPVWRRADFSPPLDALQRAPARLVDRPERVRLETRHPRHASLDAGTRRRSREGRARDQRAGYRHAATARPISRRSTG